jgi:riboflavin biosynthesis pyrimidine reductase
MSEPLQLDVLWERERPPPSRHPAEAIYGSAVTFPDTRPHLFANFVETVDGVVVFGERGGWNASTISMNSEPDRRVMALLRALADAILVGAGTFRTARTHQWTPGGLVPDEALLFDDLRAQLRGPTAGRAPLYVVTASGVLDPAQIALREPQTAVTILTTAAGAARLRDSLPPAVEVLTLEEDDRLDPGAVARYIADRDGGLILCEGGPTLLGEIAHAGLLDELFLTVAPQLAGRDEHHRRLGLIEGFAATPAEAPKLRLRSLRRAQDHLFVRYDR